MTQPAEAPRLRILHVGSGSETLPSWIEGDEVRLDIDPAVKPDVVASMTDMGAVGVFDIVYCSHALEHLYQHDIRKALSEFRRVLKPEGRAVVIVPDLEDIRPTEDVVYVSPAGPITGLDMFFGLRSCIAEHPFMAHRYGFVSATLEFEFRAAGFGNVSVSRVPGYNLLGIATNMMETA